MTMPTSAQLGLTHCNGCGQCCLIGGCHLTVEDVGRIARAAKITVAELAKTLTAFRLPDGRVRVKTAHTPAGCVYLRPDGACGIHTAKPTGGRDYECWTPSTWNTVADGRYDWTFEELRAVFPMVPPEDDA